MTALHDSAPPTNEADLRVWLNEDVWLSYGPHAPTIWGDGRVVARWIASGFASVNDAVATYRRHGRITS